MVSQLSPTQKQEAVLSPLTDRITALLKTLSWFSSQCKGPYSGPGSLHHLPSHTAWGHFITYPICAPNPATLASWMFSEHARHTSTCYPAPQAGLLFPSGICLADSAQVSLCWFLWCWGWSSQCGAHAGRVLHTELCQVASCGTSCAFTHCNSGNAPCTSSHQCFCKARTLSHSLSDTLFPL